MNRADAPEGGCPLATVVRFALFPPAGGAAGPPVAGQGAETGEETERGGTQLRGVGDSATGGEVSSEVKDAK